LTDEVIAPSESVRNALLERGVQTKISVVPTGIQTEKFAKGDGSKFRRQYGIPEQACVFGYAGRLSSEKNLELLGQAISVLAALQKDVYFLMVGKGELELRMKQIFDKAGLGSQLCAPGVLGGQELVDSYHAMDAFVFASKSETQGLVVAEAMAAGIPVVAMDAPGVREVVRNGENGILVTNESLASFVAALESYYQLEEEEKSKFRQAAILTADHFSVPRCAEKGIAVYERVIRQKHKYKDPDNSTWDMMMNRMLTEWEMLANLGKATKDAVFNPQKRKSQAKGETT